MKKIILFSFLAFVSLSGFNQTDTAYSKIAYENISLEYPSQWEALDVLGYAILVSEKANSEKLSILSNFAVEIDKNYNDINRYSKFWKDKMVKNKYMSNWKLVSEKDITYKNFEAKELVCTYKVSSLKTISKVILLVSGDKIINLNTTSSEENAIAQKATIDRIFDFVEIK